VLLVAEGSWKPANEPELMMYHALLRADTERYLRIMRDSPLYVPAVSRPSRRLLTWERGGRAYLPVFTSPDGLGSLIGTDADTVLQMSYGALTRDWPDPSSWLVLNPTTPIEASGPVDDVSVPLVGADPPGAFDPGTVAPANEVEAALAEVLAQGNTPLLLDLLVFAEVLLPTARPVAEFSADPYFPWAELPIEEPAIGVFTSRERLAEAAAGADVPYVRVPLLTVAGAWPAPEYALLVNPGSPLRARLPGPQVAGLFEWARIAAVYHGIEAPAS
jgi:hypothetical protein